MHELAICQSLLRDVERAAAAHDAVAVKKVVVAIGPLSGVEGPLLVRAFEIARLATIARHATLTVEAMPVTIRCPACGGESEVPPNALTCPRCGAWAVTLSTGNELLLKRIEIETGSDAAAA